jgi:hypothetical protein
MSSPGQDLQLNGYPQGFIDLVINSKNKEKNPLGSLYIPYVKGISEKFKRTGNRCNIRRIFRTKHTLTSSPVKIRPERNQQQTTQCICSIRCGCGRSYTGETGRPLALRSREHRHNLKEGSPEKSKLANIPMKRVIGYVKMTLEFWKLKVTAGIGNTKIRPI